MGVVAVAFEKIQSAIRIKSAKVVQDARKLTTGGKTLIGMSSLKIYLYYSG